MKKFLISLLIIIVLYFIADNIGLIKNRDRSSAPTMQEVERAFNNKNGKYVGN